MRTAKKYFIMVPALVALLFPASIFSSYIEGIDTTDSNGISRDSLFKVGPYSNNSIQLISGIKMTYFGGTFNDYGTAYFNYRFEDIVKVPDTFMVNSNAFQSPLNTCFIIQRVKDSCYEKLTILQKLPDGRYIYRYGLQTTPKNLLLIQTNYDRTIKYKPNALFRNTIYSHYDSLIWEPPISNNNHLVGYILYLSKTSTIDTNNLNNPAQWDSVAFVTSNHSCTYTRGGSVVYFNMVTVYTEGKSDFLLGLTLLPVAVGVSPFTHFPLQQTASTLLNISKNGHLYQFNFAKEKPRSGSILTASGREIMRFTDISDDRVIWNASESNCSEGMCIFRALFPENKEVCEKIMITR